MKSEQQVIEGLKALRMEIEAGIEEPADQLLLLADVCGIMGLSESQSREIMGLAGWELVQQAKGEPAGRQWPSKDLLEHLSSWPGVKLSPAWSQRLEAMRLAV